MRWIFMIRALAVALFTATVGLAPVPLSSRASAQHDPKLCAAIQQDAKRLECFDLIFKKSSTTTSPSNSKWMITEEKSKIDEFRKRVLERKID